MIETYALTKEGSEYPIEIGSIDTIVRSACKLKYQDDPTTKYDISEIEIKTVKHFTQEDIMRVLEKVYDGGYL
jgi:hypothetical protein